jgi:beta-lactam-binding protein with PASTA domain
VRLLSAVAVCLLLVGCGTGTPATSGSPAGNSAAEQWVMPDLVGSNLQQAQDSMQKLTGNPAFLTTSHDATDQKRNQIADRNWKICSQNIKAGESITLKSVIDFGAVKNEETCP